MDVIDGRLAQVIFHKPSKYSPSGTPFLIGRLADGTTVKGEMRRPHVGVDYRFWGGHGRDKRSGQPQFDFSTYEEVMTRDAHSIAQYFARNVPGLGVKKARDVVDHFGLDALDILRLNPERLSEVAGIGDGITAKITEWLRDNATNPATFAELIGLFDGLRVPKSIPEQLIRDFGAGAPGYVREYPYALLAYPRIGWAITDQFAVQRVGIDPKSVIRQAASLLESLERISSDGHTWAPPSTVFCRASELIGYSPSPQALKLITEDKQGLAFGEDRVALAKYARAEERIAKRLAILAERADFPPIELHPAGLDGLSLEQIRALEMIARSPVSVLTGGPGTGKTYTITRFLASLPRDSWGSIRCAAPTGKAAQRIAQLLQASLGEDAQRIMCSTIHRLLAGTPTADKEKEGVPESSAKIGRGLDQFAWGHNADNPIDASILIVDELSMCDARLAAGLFDAVGLNTRLILIGDPHQLPSVAPGAVLRDLCTAAVLPHTHLSEPRRNAGLIVELCHGILTGRVPDPVDRPDYDNGRNWIHYEVEDAEIADTIDQIIVAAKSFDPWWEVQVLSAQKQKLPYACDRLNGLIGSRLNPYRKVDRPSSPGDDAPLDVPAHQIVIGDKVVRTSNGDGKLLIPMEASVDEDFDWETGTFDHETLTRFLTLDNVDYGAVPTTVVNGDMGTVEHITDPRPDVPAQVVVKFKWPDRRIALPYAEHALTPAYAMTIHKSQGSGFPCVVIPVSNRFYWDNSSSTGLWCRELFYTAASRAEKLLITVGKRDAINAAVKRVTINQRRTMLPAFLKSTFGDAF